MLRFAVIFGLVFMAGSVSAQVCSVVSSTCTNTQTLNVGGIEIGSACTEVAQIETCHVLNPENTCGVLEARFEDAEGTCVETSSSCLVLNDGQCMEWTRQIQCVNGPLDAEPATLINRSFTNLVETIENSCTEQEADPSCSLYAESDDGASSRVINGMPLTRTWWQRDLTYECGTGHQENTCETLEASPICRISATVCGQEDGQGSCVKTDYTYICEADPSFGVSCNPVNTCIGDTCAGEEEEDTTEDFAHASAWLNFLDQAAEQNNCEAREGVELPVEQEGEGGVFESVTEEPCATEFGDDGITDDGSMELRVFGGTYNDCRYTAWWNCCNSSGYDSCYQNEHDLHISIEAGAATHFASECAKRNFIGLCMFRKRRYCTYNSKFARVFQEQAHVQNNRQFAHGTPDPCPGLTLQELEALDVSQMNLSEIYGDMLEEAEVPVEQLVISELETQLGIMEGDVQSTLE